MPSPTVERAKDNPWLLKTPPGTAEFTMHTDTKDGIPILVCTVGKTVLHYDARCITGPAHHAEKARRLDGSRWCR